MRQSIGCCGFITIGHSPYAPIHDQTQPYPRSRATLSTITRDPIHDQTQPYPRSDSTLSTIECF